jgi:hypothetical protein
MQKLAHSEKTIAISQQAERLTWWLSAYAGAHIFRAAHAGQA